MNGILKGMLLTLLLVYIISPVDLCPGPIDDIILAICGFCQLLGSSTNESYYE